MGVAGLWDVIRPASVQRSLTTLAVVDGFEANTHGQRGFRIGIDASIWFFHAAYGREGENPELRTLFFRCARLMNLPFLPLFVFDGAKRPEIKRGKRINRQSQHWMVAGMKNMIDAFGFEWREAPGEAEAELAYLNSIGVIDAVLSDDVDNFLFGATMVIRNPSATLSGNKGHPTLNSAGKDDGNHVKVYSSSAILAHPDIGLTRGGFILIGLLSGGDYHQAGLPRCGPKIALGLARAGFGDRLLTAAHALPRSELPEFLEGWRADLRTELRTNASGHVGRKQVALAAAVPDTFPDVDILLSYTHPITSETEGRTRGTDVKWSREPDVGAIAGLCELYFEWGVRDIIIKRFRTVLWPSAVQRILRRGALDLDEKGKRMPETPHKTRPGRLTQGTPNAMIWNRFSSTPGKAIVRREQEDDESSDEEEEADRLITKIHSFRHHTSTDGLHEYRLEVAPAILVQMAESGVKGIRPPLDREDSEDGLDEDEEEGGSKKKKKAPPDERCPLRVWMPACMVKAVYPALVQQFEDDARAKEAKKAGKAKAKVDPLSKGKAKANSPVRAKAAAPRRKAKATLPSSDESDAETPPMAAVVARKAVPKSFPISSPPPALAQPAPKRKPRLPSPAEALSTQSKVAALFSEPVGEKLNLPRAIAPRAESEKRVPSIPPEPLNRVSTSTTSQATINNFYTASKGSTSQILKGKAPKPSVRKKLPVFLELTDDSEDENSARTPTVVAGKKPARSASQPSRIQASGLPASGSHLGRPARGSHLEEHVHANASRSQPLSRDVSMKSVDDAVPRKAPMATSAQMLPAREAPGKRINSPNLPDQVYGSPRRSSKHASPHRDVDMAPTRPSSPSPFRIGKPLRRESSIISVSSDDDVAPKVAAPKLPPLLVAKQRALARLKREAFRDADFNRRDEVIDLT